MLCFTRNMRWSVRILSWEKPTLDATGWYHHYWAALVTLSGHGHWRMGWIGCCYQRLIVRQVLFSKRNHGNLNWDQLFSGSKHNFQSWESVFCWWAVLCGVTVEYDISNSKLVYQWHGWCHPGSGHGPVTALVTTHDTLLQHIILHYIHHPHIWHVNWSISFHIPVLHKS